MAQPQPPDWDPRVQRLRRRGLRESLRGYALRRLGVAVVTLLGITLVMFVLFRVLVA